MGIDVITVHDEVIKWKHFPRYWPFVRGIDRSPVNSPHKGQWRGALMMFSLICVWINGWVNNREAGNLRRYRGHYDLNVMDFSVAYRFSLQVTLVCETTCVMSSPVQRGISPRQPRNIILVTYLYVKPLQPIWISDSYRFHLRVPNEITYPFPNFSVATVEVWKWIINFIPHLTGHVITDPC